VHLYLPAKPFTALANDEPAFVTAEVLYCAGFRDPLIQQIVEVIFGEMRSETPSGKVLVQSLAHSLAARLLEWYSSLSLTLSPAKLKRPQLDSRRLQRVLAFIEAYIGTDITVAQLAAAAPQ
jgi:AraC family transcriptional regulator